MIIMPVPKDIRTVKAKFIGPFTKRQTMAIVPSAIIAVILFTLLGELVSSDVIIGAIVIFDTPVLLCGFVDVYGMPLWVYAKDVAIGKIFAPRNRPYETENTYAGFAKQNRITYEYFDGDLEEYTPKERKKKEKQNQKRLNQFLKEHPEYQPLQ